jgi:hypothetical protein
VKGLIFKKMIFRGSGGLALQPVQCSPSSHLCDPGVWAMGKPIEDPVGRRTGKDHLPKNPKAEDS